MKTKAFTLVELLITIAVVAMAVILLFPGHHGHKAKAARIYCINNLKQVGLGIRVWAADHGNRLPNQVSTNEGGAMEILLAGNLVSTFRNLSNELSTPTILHCPSDADVRPATAFPNLEETNLSYFLSVDALPSSSELFLSGDRNITNGTKLVAGLLNVSSNAPAGWNEKIHQKAGNIAISDGSVQQLSINGLKDFTKAQPDPTRLALPRANRNPMD